MSLRIRLTLLMAAMVCLTVLASWWIAGKHVIAPFAKEVIGAYLDEASYVADQIEAGADPSALGEKLHLEVRVRSRPPRGLRRGRHHGHGKCEDLEHRGRAMIMCHGPKAPVAIKIAQGWVVVRRDLDIHSPKQRIGRFLLLVLIGVLAVAAWIGTVATRPLRATRLAMERVAAGDLQHRIPVDGPKELADAGRAFNAMAERVQDMLRTERSLMAGISHELRTPLARLRLQTELLRDKGGPGDRLDAMEQDLGEIDHLIGEMLEFSRFALGERKLASAPIDLAAVVTEAIERSSPGQRSITVTGTCAQTAGDHDRLVRVVQNLLQNALKYTPGDTPIEVHLDGTRVDVLDRGPGVPERALSRLFEPFYRVDGVSRDKAGLGLGLMIAHQIVTLHGGMITASNRPEGGLAVQIELP